jgi:4-amino-4-deoxy-L-arabinose transferase-like glycosyltransferase
MKNIVVCFLLISQFFSGLGVRLNSNQPSDRSFLGATTQKHNNQWPVDSFSPIPFTIFSTGNNEVTLEIKANALETRFVKNGSVWLDFPKGELPIKLLNVGPDKYVIIMRKLFSGELSFLYFADGITKISEFPDEFSEVIFKEAVFLNNEIITIQYNPQTATNILLAWNIQPDNSIKIKRGFFRELLTAAQAADTVFHVALGNVPEINSKGLYIASGSDVFVFTNRNKNELNSIKFEEDLSLIELVTNGNNVAGLYLINGIRKEVSEINKVSSYKFINLVSQSPLREGKIAGIPWNPGNVDGAGSVDFVESQDSLIKLFTKLLVNQSQSGLMELGTNNYEGLVATSQVNYLSGFITLISQWPGFEISSENFKHLQDQIKLRLDLEMYLLDRLLDEGNPGLNYRQDTPDRESVILVNDSARLLSLILNYQKNVPDPITLENVEKITDEVVSFKNTVDEISISNGLDPDIEKGYAFIRHKKGSPVPLDGANTPYEYQNEWVLAISSLSAENKSSDVIVQTRQMLLTFLKNISINGMLPEDYRWPSAYGWLANGWTSADDISSNQAEYAGDLSLSDVRSRSVDIKALLSFAESDKSILTENFRDYLDEGIKKGKLLPVINPYYYKVYGKVPDLPNSQLWINYLFNPSNKDIDSRVWGFLYSMKDFDKTRQGAINGSPPLNTPVDINQKNDNSPINDKQNELLFLLSACFLLGSSFFLISHFRIKSITVYLIGFYLLFISQIVLIFETASLFHMAGSKEFVLISNISIFLCSILFWLIYKKPSLYDPFSHLNKDIKKSLLSIKKSFLEYPAIWLFGFGIYVALLYTAYLIFYIPQNVDDVLTTNLARVGFWLQSGSFSPWKTSPYNLPQVISPPNSQILNLWTVLFYGTDQLAAFTQWTASLISVLAIYGLCRQLMQSQPLALFIALLYLTIPAVALQLSTAQTDILSTSLFIASVYLLFPGWRDNDKSLLILSGLSFALGVGTKQTVLFAAPGLAIFLLILFMKYREQRWKKAATWIAASLGSFVLVGAYFYIQNILIFGRPFGPETVTQSYTQIDTFSFFDQILMGFGNFTAYVLMSAFSEFFSPQLIAVGDLVSNILSKFGISLNYYRGSLLPVSSGTSGPLILLIGFLGILSGIRKWMKEKDPLHLGLVIIGVLYFVILLFIRKFSEAIFRYSLISLALFLPLFGNFDLLFKDFDLRKLKSNIVVGILSIVALFIMGWSITADGAKSLYSKVALPGMDRTFKQTILMPEYYPSYKLIDEFIPGDSSIGVIGTGRIPISPLFGKYYSRIVVQIIPSSAKRVNMGDFQKTDYLMVDSQLIKDGLLLPDGYVRITKGVEYNLFRRTSENTLTD